MSPHGLPPGNLDDLDEGIGERARLDVGERVVLEVEVLQAAARPTHRAVEEKRAHKRELAGKGRGPAAIFRLLQWDHTQRRGERETCRSGGRGRTGAATVQIQRPPGRVPWRTLAAHEHDDRPGDAVKDAGPDDGQLVLGDEQAPHTSVPDNRDGVELVVGEQHLGTVAPNRFADKMIFPPSMVEYPLFTWWLRAV